MKSGYTYDPKTDTLTMTASFAKKASRMGTFEYNTIRDHLRNYPKTKIVTVEKEGHKRISYAEMQKFITNHRNASDLQKEFESVRTLSCIHSMPYKYVRSWFDKRFPYYGDYEVDADGFVVDPTTLNSMKEMIQEVTTRNIQEAVPAEDAAA